MVTIREDLQTVSHIQKVLPRSNLKEGKWEKEKKRKNIGNNWKKNYQQKIIYTYEPL